MSLNKVVMGIIAATLLTMGATIAIYFGVGYVAYHFIHKYW